MNSRSIEEVQALGPWRAESLAQAMRNARMQDDDLGFVALDPAKLLPFWGKSGSDEAPAEVHRWRGRPLHGIENLLVGRRALADRNAQPGGLLS
jgi:hypothetical protein